MSNIVFENTYRHYLYIGIFVGSPKYDTNCTRENTFLKSFLVHF